MDLSPRKGGEGFCHILLTKTTRPSVFQGRGNRLNEIPWTWAPGAIEGADGVCSQALSSAHVQHSVSGIHHSDEFLYRPKKKTASSTVLCWGCEILTITAPPAGITLSFTPFHSIHLDWHVGLVFRDPDC